MINKQKFYSLLVQGFLVASIACLLSCRASAGVSVGERGGKHLKNLNENTKICVQLSSHPVAKVTA